MIRTTKPKNARSKRAQDDRAPKLTENAKTTLIMRGSSTSLLIQNVLTDLNSLKKPLTIKFTKKNAVHPFEDHSTFEFFSEKNDASLLAFGTHSKKRPHNLTIARTFDYKLLDMYEFGVEEATYKGLEQFNTQKPTVGMKPMLLFTGDVWERDEEMMRVRNLWMDFFRGETVGSVDVEGLQYVLSFTAVERGNFHIRGHMIRTKKSGQKLPRVEVEETGPRMDCTIRRTREPDADMLKEALKTPRKQIPKTKKNIGMNVIGDKIAKIHTGKQDLGKLQTRKMKGLKKRELDEDDDATMVDEEEAPKRARKD
ncbi:Brix domain-containing protein [Pyronema domesticum]|uniref:Ribosome production factor 2 homolog n=1 Tax=Pyronema omphalodes (strain CBS 100304) TaxID=1076935 RepID=U4LFD0_PYROM|nr:Brix domain-containing protein [Pyronema domesticum]CCX10207.1 Similar to Ribosome production factor 2 homolog; acc. no. Q9UUG1 [Pyronema omphalodes CBS 100304]